MYNIMYEVEYLEDNRKLLPLAPCKEHTDRVQLTISYNSFIKARALPSRTSVSTKLLYGTVSCTLCNIDIHIIWYF